MRIAYFDATYYNTRKAGSRLNRAAVVAPAPFRPVGACMRHGFRFINNCATLARTPMPATQLTLADAPPNETAVTVYDRDHLKLYMRLLDASDAGASLEEVSSVLLGIDAKAEPERARRVHDSHLSRARWMTEQGYREILRNGLPLE